MRIIIAGAGQVGTRVAAELDATHDVVMIDVDTERIDRLSYDLDVLTVTGDSSAIETLREASIEDTDIPSPVQIATKQTSSPVPRRSRSPMSLPSLASRT